MSNIRDKLVGPPSRSHLFIELVTNPTWRTGLIFFSMIYVPFVVQYGWDYQHIRSIDLPSFYSASVHYFRHGGSPYDIEGLNSLMAPIGVYPYLYPPASLLFFYPFSFLDYSTARQLLLWTNHLVLLGLLLVIPWFLLRGSTHKGTTFKVAIILVYMLNFSPIVLTLSLGQINFFVLGFLVAFWIRADNGKPASAGLFLALAIFLKTYPLVLLPALLIVGRRRECFSTCVWLMLGFVVAWVIFPAEMWSEWILKVVPTGGYTCTPVGLYGPAVPSNLNFNGFFVRRFTESEWSNPITVDVRLARNLTYLVSGLIVLVSGLAVWIGSKKHTDTLSLVMLVALPGMFLVTPFSWDHHLVLVLPAILMLLVSRSSLPLPANFLFYSASTGTAIILGMVRFEQSKFYASIILWALCAFAACSSRIHLRNEAAVSST